MRDWSFYSEQFKAVFLLFGQLIYYVFMVSAEDAVFLQQAGINVAQGYYYGKPVTASEFKHRFMRCIQPYQPC